jgi:hypothetical protein
MQIFIFANKARNCGALVLAYPLEMSPGLQDAIKRCDSLSFVAADSFAESLFEPLGYV